MAESGAAAAAVAFTQEEFVPLFRDVVSELRTLYTLLRTYNETFETTKTTYLQEHWKTIGNLVHTKADLTGFLTDSLYTIEARTDLVRDDIKRLTDRGAKLKNMARK